MSVAYIRNVDTKGKVTSAWWECTACGARFLRRKPADHHVNGIAGSRGPSCPRDPANLRRAATRRFALDAAAAAAAVAQKWGTISVETLVIVGVAIFVLAAGYAVCAAEEDQKERERLGNLFEAAAFEEFAEQEVETKKEPTTPCANS
jgi:hypothetical protein